MRISWRGLMSSREINDIVLLNIFKKKEKGGNNSINTHNSGHKFI
jgi:hypothetical protein